MIEFGHAKIASTLHQPLYIALKVVSNIEKSLQIIFVKWYLLRYSICLCGHMQQMVKPPTRMLWNLDKGYHKISKQWQCDLWYLLNLYIKNKITSQLSWLHQCDPLKASLKKKRKLKCITAFSTDNFFLVLAIFSITVCYLIACFHSYK